MSVNRCKIIFLSQFSHHIGLTHICEYVQTFLFLNNFQKEKNSLKSMIRDTTCSDPGPTQDQLEAYLVLLHRMVQVKVQSNTVVETVDFSGYKSFATMLLRVCLPYNRDYSRSPWMRQDLPKFESTQVQSMMDRLEQSMKIHFRDSMPTGTGNLETFEKVIIDWLLQQNAAVKIQSDDIPDLVRQKSDLIQTTNDENADSEAGLADADFQNAEQLTMISTRFTIWNCVSTFSAQPGNKDWELLSLVLELLHFNGCECPWMRGDELGVFGETPLHIALLFNKVDYPGFEGFFKKLWERCPKLRTLYYRGRLYRGENVLHLAIIRNFGKRFIESLLQTFTQGSDDCTKFVNQRAVGSFFKQDTLSDGFCNLLGETPLCFAACSHQLDIFELLVKFGAEVEVKTNKEEHNLLHLMILNQNFKNQGDHTDKLYIKMYDSVAEFIETRAPGAKLDRSVNKSCFTPRILAAAEGSCKMFIHLFDDKLETAWSYGPLKCLKMYLDDVEDVDDEVTVDDLNPQRPTILATLVKNQRKDVFSSSQIERLVNVKWVKYGRDVFQRKFILTGLFTISIFFLPMIQFQTSIIGYATHFLCHIFAVYISEHICVKKVENSILLKWVFGVKDVEKGYLGTVREFTAWVYGCFFTRPDFGKWFAGIKKGLLERDLDLIFYALAPLCLKLLTVLFVCRIWIAPQAESVIMLLLACRSGLFIYYQLPLLGELPKMDFAQVDLTLAALFVFSVASRISFGPVSDLAVGILESMECWLYFLLGVLSFSIGISDITVLEKFGAFVFSLIKITKSDLPIFFTIYGAFLILFAHAHYLGSNKLHAGIQEGVDSIWRIFQAMLGQFYDPAVDDQAKSSCPATMDHAATTDHAKNSNLSPITRCMVTSISVTNYFLVSVVLINVLIAMLSNSYQQCREEAKSLWKLHRASIIVKIDMRMSSSQVRQCRMQHAGLKLTGTGVGWRRICFGSAIIPPRSSGTHHPGLQERRSGKHAYSA